MAEFTIKYPHSSTGKEVSFQAVIPDGKENDQEFIDKLIDAHKTEGSAKKGSLKAAPPSGAGQGVLSGLANTIGYPIQHMMDTLAAQGEPGHTGFLGGLEDTASAAFDELAVPGLVRGGLKGLWPAAKAAAGYTAGSNIAEKTGQVLGAPEEVSRGVGMIAGTGAGLATSSPKVAAKVKSGVEASKNVPVGRYSSPGAMAGYGAGAAAGHAMGLPSPLVYGTAGPIGAAVGAKASPFMSGLRAPNAEPLIDPLFTGQARTASTKPVSLGEAPINAVNQSEIIQPAQGAGPVRPPVQPASSTIPVSRPVAVPPVAQGTGPVRPPLAPSVPTQSAQVPVQPAAVPETGLGASPYRPVKPPLAPKAETLPARPVTRPTPRVVGPVRPPIKEPTLTPEQAGQKLTGQVRQEALRESPQPQPKSDTNIDTPKKEPAKVLEFKKNETPKETKSASEQAETKQSEGTKEKPKEPESKTEDAKPKNVIMDELLGKHTDWNGKSQIQYPHIKALAEKLGTSATQVGRILTELNYDVAPSKYHKGYGINRPGKSDYGKSDVEFKTLLKAFKGLSEE